MYMVTKRPMNRPDKIPMTRASQPYLAEVIHVMSMELKNIMTTNMAGPRAYIVSK